MYLIDRLVVKMNSAEDGAAVLTFIIHNVGGPDETFDNVSLSIGSSAELQFKQPIKTYKITMTRKPVGSME